MGTVIAYLGPKLKAPIPRKDGRPVRLPLSLRHWRPFALCLAAAVLVFAVPGAHARSASPSARPVAAIPYTESNPLLAYYYGWWDPQNFSRSLYHPVVDYNSDDPAMIRQQIAQAQGAGIDGFIISWYGIGDRTDRNLQKLLEFGQESDFRATIHFETPLFAKYGVEDVVNQLQAFYANRIGHPSLVTYQGRPVIFFWWVESYDNATWSSIRNRVDPEHRAVWLADGDRFDVLASDAWEGISPYNSAWSASPGASLASWKAKARAVAPEKLFVPVAQPGHDDSAARPTSFIRNRDGGAYYEASLQGALASGPDWAITINSFNEWLEATQIEPSREYGNLYLDITGSFAALFKGIAAASLTPVAPPHS